MTENSTQCHTLAFYDVVDNLVDGIQAFDFSNELSTDMCDVYELPQDDGSRILVYIDYGTESITSIRRTGENDETLRSFVDADYTPALVSDIARIIYESIR